MPPRFQYARRKARELLQMSGLMSVPISVEKIAEYLRAEIRYSPYEGGLSGMIHRKPDGSSVIGINSQHPRNRQRFTIAHELAHLFLHKDEIFHIDDKYLIGFRNADSDKGTNDNEVEANQFAAELLMPEEYLLLDVQKFTSQVEPELAIAQLAVKYEVSTQAMTIRLKALDVLE